MVAVGEVGVAGRKARTTAGAALAATALAAGAFVTTTKPEIAHAVDETLGAEFTTRPPNDSVEAAVRQARGGWFDRGHARLSEKHPWHSLVSCYGPGHVPDLPIGHSTTVLIGDVLSARAFLSAHATTVYSEFASS